MNYGPRIVRDGLVLHLDAANPKSYPGSGTVWKDLSGKGNDGTLVNGVGYDAANNGSMTSDGVDDYTTTEYIGNRDTVSVWFNRNTLACADNAPVLVGRRSVGCYTHAIYTVATAGTEDIYLRWYRSGPEDFIVTGLRRNNWYNLVIRRTDSSSEFYINGQYISEDTGKTNVDTRNIGGSCSGANSFPGKISNVQVYNRALSPEEIQQNFNSLRGRYGI